MWITIGRTECRVLLRGLVSGAGGGETPLPSILRGEGVSRVLFVDVSRICDGSLAGSLGESAVGHFGDDKALHTANEFSFYNTGDEGLKMRALVYGD